MPLNDCSVLGSRPGWHRDADRPEPRARNWKVVPAGMERQTPANIGTTSSRSSLRPATSRPHRRGRTRSHRALNAPLPWRRSRAGVGSAPCYRGRCGEEPEPPNRPARRASARLGRVLVSNAVIVCLGKGTGERDPCAYSSQRSSKRIDSASTTASHSSIRPSTHRVTLVPSSAGPNGLPCASYAFTARFRSSTHSATNLRNGMSGSSRASWKETSRIDESVHQPVKPPRTDAPMYNC